MATVQLHVIVQNSLGMYAQLDTTFQLTGGDEPLPPVIDSVDVDPAEGPQGTLFTITVNAHDQNVPPLPLTYSAMAGRVGGVSTTIHPLPGQPNVFTWQS